LLEYFESIIVVTIAQPEDYLAIESTLAKDTSNKCAILNEWFNLANNVIFGVGWRTNDDDVCCLNYPLWVI
jgi:hypothetical protein